VAKLSKRIEDLQFDAYKAAEEAILEMIDKGIGHAVTSTWREDEVQIALYSQGRESLEMVNAKRKAAKLLPIMKVENFIVTNCDGVKNKSKHQTRTAIDIVPLTMGGLPCWPDISDKRWRDISAIMVKHGFRWGGDWNGDGRTRSDGDMSETMVDYPHFEKI
jgi:hypothetical protein